MSDNRGDNPERSPPAPSGTAAAEDSTRRSGWRRRFIRSWMLWPFFLLLLVTREWTTTLLPPSHPSNPTIVLLSDYGKHSSLLLPGPNGGMDEYAFGDWGYFAIARKGVSAAITALVHSPQSTLGRRHLALNADAPYVNELIGADRTQRLVVDGDRVAALRHDLDLEYTLHRTSEHYNPEEHMYFVYCDQSYSLLHNCNSVTAEWLKKLGVQVQGPALTPVFKIEAPSER